MKKAINLQGIEVDVPLDTPVKTVDGVHYLLNDSDRAEIAAKEAAYASKSAERALLATIEARKKEYGPPEEQLEFIAENGLEAWKLKVEQIKTKYPKA